MEKIQFLLNYGKFSGTGYFKVIWIYKAHFTQFPDVVIGHSSAYPDFGG